MVTVILINQKSQKFGYLAEGWRKANSHFRVIFDKKLNQLYYASITQQVTKVIHIFAEDDNIVATLETAFFFILYR